MALDRMRNPGDAVHVDFLRHIGGLPSCTHKWTLLAELGRRPLQLRWMVLTARFWLRVRDMPRGRMVREAMEDNIRLYRQARNGDCWTACFLNALVECNALSLDQLTSCNSPADIWDLPIDEFGIRSQLTALYDTAWECTDTNPRTAESEAVTACTYKQWVRGGDGAGPAGSSATYAHAGITSR